MSQKRSLESALIPAAPSLARKAQRAAWRRPDPRAAAINRIIDTQALKIDQLENELLEYQKRVKSIEWAKTELDSVMAANKRWKEHCEQLQRELSAEATGSLKREQDLYKKVATHEQEVVKLRRDKDELRQQLSESQQTAAYIQQQCDHFKSQAMNSEHLRKQAIQKASIPTISEECTRLQQVLSSTRAELSEVRQRELSSMQGAAEAQVELKQVQQELDQATAQNRMNTLRQEHTDSLQDELTSARKQIQDLLQDSKRDEVTLLQQALSRKTLLYEKAKARADTADKEFENLLEVTRQRDDLKDQLATLQSTMRDVQTATGATDVREVVRRYQAHEVKAEQIQEQLRGRIEQLQSQEAQLLDQIGTLKSSNQELEVRLSGTEAHVERIKDVQRTSEGEIAFLRARLDFHMTAADAVAKRGEADGKGSDRASMPEAAEVARLQTVLDEIKQVVQTLEDRRKEADEYLATAMASKKTAEVRLEQAHRSIDGLKLALETERLTASTPAQTTEASAADPSASAVVIRDFSQHQMLVIQRENERLRAQVKALARSQADEAAGRVQSPVQGDPGRQDSLLSMPSLGNQPSHVTAVPETVLLKAELAIAQQTVIDYKARVEALATYFTESMQDYRSITADVLGWSVEPKRGVADDTTTYTFALEGKDEHTVSVQRGDEERLQVDTSAPWLASSEIKEIVSRYQQKEVSTPELFSTLLTAASTE